MVKVQVLECDTMWSSSTSAVTFQKTLTSFHQTAPCQIQNTTIRSGQIYLPEPPGILPPFFFYVFYGNHKYPFTSYKTCQAVVSYARKGISIDTQYSAGDHLHFEIDS